MIKIAALGDSLTAGNTLGKNDRNWTDLLAERTGAEVRNCGIGGQTSSQGLARMEKDVLSHAPDIVLILFGMNDHVITNTNGQSSVSEAVFRSNLTEMATQACRHGIKPVFITPNAVMEEYYYTRHPQQWYAPSGGVTALLAQYCEIIREVAESMHAPLVDLFAESRRQDLSKLLRTPENGGAPDGVHPYGAGIPFYAEHILSVLAETVL